MAALNKGSGLSVDLVLKGLLKMLKLKDTPYPLEGNLQNVGLFAIIHLSG